MSLYLDASVLLKLLRPEPESPRVAEIVGRSDELVISALARLEALVVIEGWLAGGLPKRNADRCRAALDRLQALPETRFVECPASVFEIAETQLASVYCPTLDRLHLALMQQFAVTRLFTNDRQQANAARALGYEVLTPG